MKTLPSWCYVFFAVAIFLTIVLILAWPRTIELSYGERTCVFQPTLFPGLFESNSETFKLESSQRFVVGGLALGSLEMCVKVIKAPEVGSHTAGLTITGLPILQKTYSIIVPQYPVASARSIQKPIPITHSLGIELSEADRLFSYVVSFDNKYERMCEMEGSRLLCDISGLDLQQGRTYAFSLDRYFNQTKMGNVISQEITTLRSVKILKTSIKNTEIIYSKPKHFDIWFDKKIKLVDATLAIKGERDGDIPIETKISGKKLRIVWQKNLARQTTYRFTLHDVIAEDGSTVQKEYLATFTLSGGPRVTSISVGSYKVPLNSMATVSFDQEILMSQNLGVHISATSGAKVVGVKGNQVYVSFAGVAPCTTVKIGIDDSLKSKYGISGGSAWSYTTRTICQTVTTIGTSVQGRTLSAYWFGNGPKTIVYTGAIHGDEVSTYHLMLHWIDALEAGYYSIPNNTRIVVIPVVNPDGLASGTRTNARNVDLNRNFDTSDWKKNITNVYNQPFPGGGGAARLSEPESKAVAGLISQLKPTLVVSYHSIGSVILANPASKANQHATTYATFSGYSFASSSADTFNYTVTGTADDYYWERLGIASIVVELGSHTYHQFPQNRNAMWKMLQ